MSLRNGNIGFVVAVGWMALGLTLVGFDPSDTELQLVCWSATIAGFVVTFGLCWRDVRRSTGRRPPRS